MCFISHFVPQKRFRWYKMDIREPNRQAWSRPEFRLLPLRDSMLFGYCLVAGRRLLPSERIAQHLSEWAQTAGIHDQNAASASIAAPAGSGQ